MSDSHNPPPLFLTPQPYFLFICLFIIYISLFYSYCTSPNPETHPLNRQEAEAEAAVQGCPPWDDKYSDDDDDDDHDDEEPSAGIEHNVPSEKDNEKLPLNPGIPDKNHKPELKPLRPQAGKDTHQLVLPALPPTRRVCSNRENTLGAG